MTRAEAAAAIGRRVRVEGGPWDGYTDGRIKHLSRRLVVVWLPGHWTISVSAYRLHLIDEPKED